MIPTDAELSHTCMDNGFRDWLMGIQLFSLGTSTANAGAFPHGRLCYISHLSILLAWQSWSLGLLILGEVILQPPSDVSLLLCCFFFYFPSSNSAHNFVWLDLFYACYIYIFFTSNRNLVLKYRLNQFRTSGQFLPPSSLYPYLLFTLRIVVVLLDILLSWSAALGAIFVLRQLLLAP